MSHSKVQSAKLSVWFPVGTLLLMVAAAFAVKVLLNEQANLPPEDTARIEERLKARDELRASNQSRLETYAWTDKEAGTVQIPIEVAMKLAVADLQGHKPMAVESPTPVSAAGETAPADTSPTKTKATAPASAPAQPAATPAKPPSAQ